MTYERGPFVVEELPLGPVVVTPGTFARLLADVIPAQAGAGEAFAAAARDVAGAELAGGDEAYASTVVAGGVDLEAEVASFPVAEVEPMRANGENVDRLRASVTPYLPPVDAPVTVSFEEPPGPPAPEARPPEEPTGPDTQQPAEGE